MTLCAPTVTPFMVRTLHALQQEASLASFRLAGGTSIALLRGHRQSIDLDLFTDQRIVLTQLDESVRKFTLLTKTQSSIGCTYEFPDPDGGPSLKVDFCNWRTPFLHPPLVVEGLRLTDLRESCADKFNAITGRHELKDVWDIAELLKIYDLAQMVAFYRQKHPFLDHREPIRALTQFTYNQPANFRILNGETLETVRQRVERALETLKNKPVVERNLQVPPEYKEKMAQKKLDEKPDPKRPPLKRRGPRM